MPERASGAAAQRALPKEVVKSTIVSYFLTDIYVRQALASRTTLKTDPHGVSSYIPNLTRRVQALPQSEIPLPQTLQSTDTTPRAGEDFEYWVRTRKYQDPTTLNEFTRERLEQEYNQIYGGRGGRGGGNRPTFQGSPEPDEPLSEFLRGDGESDEEYAQRIYDNGDRFEDAYMIAQQHYQTLNHLSYRNSLGDEGTQTMQRLDRLLANVMREARNIDTGGGGSPYVLENGTVGKRGLFGGRKRRDEERDQERYQELSKNFDRYKDAIAGNPPPGFERDTPKREQAINDFLRSEENVEENAADIVTRWKLGRGLSREEEEYLFGTEGGLFGFGKKEGFFDRHPEVKQDLDDKYY